MSILIKGMEMPTEGEMLCINIYPSGTVCINLDLKCKRVANAVQVPPHGRLIDADAFINKHYDLAYLEKAMTGSKAELQTALTNMPIVINNAPTIIPAEEAND